METALGTIETVVREYLPDGAFWQQPGVQLDALDRWVRAVGLAFHGTGAILGTDDAPGLVEFMSCLNVFMLPATTPFRSVLLQYYEYLQIPTCTPIPNDLEELRAIVVGAATASAVNTPAGLRSWINAQLPLVEVSESLPLFVPPLVPPVPADGWWAVVEIWYSPLLNNADIILCVSRPVVRASNDIRLVFSKAVWSVTPSAFPVVLASEVALLWSEQRSSTDLVVKRFTLLMAELESVTLTAVTPADSVLGNDIFPLIDGTHDAHDEIWTVSATRTFPDDLGVFSTMNTVAVTL